MAKKKAAINARKCEKDAMVRAMRAISRKPKKPEPFDQGKALEVGGLVVMIQEYLKFAESVLPMCLNIGKRDGDYGELPKIHRLLNRTYQILRSI